MVKTPLSGRSIGRLIPLRFIPSRPLQAPIHGAYGEAAERRSMGGYRCR
jgi:hypothetical protein